MRVGAKLAVGFGLALAGFACVPVSGPNSNSGYSLVAGPLLAQTATGKPACGGDVTCLAGFSDWRIDATTLAGRAMPSRLTVRVAHMSSPAVGFHVVLLVLPLLPDGVREGRVMALARPGQEACVEAAILSEARIAVPPYARRRRDHFCFTL